MAKKKIISKSELLCKTIVEGMQEVKAKDIVILDLRNVSSAVCDFFVICTGDSNTQVDGISSSVNRYTRKQIQDKPWRIEGKQNREWILMDYVDVVVHVFYKETRAFFELEELWADAVRTDIPNLN